MGLEFLLLPMIFVPMLLGFLPLVVKNTKVLNFVVVVTSILDLALCVYFMVFQGSYQESVVAINWFSGFGIKFKINGLGILQAVATSIIWVGSSVFSQEYFDHAPKNLRRYYAFFSVTLGA
ncbi:MAG: hypothetical protein RR728_10115, partial [Oscillospiraceae bacterium]